MGKLIKFPAHRVVYNNEPIRPELSEEEARQIKEDKFVEQITESLILDIIHVLQENVVDTKTITDNAARGSTRAYAANIDSTSARA